MVIAGGIGPRYVEGQEGKLRAVATVIEGADGTRVAIVACDILMIRREYLDAAADRIEGELGIPASNVLINATHTHHAPATVNAHGYDGIEIFGARVRDGVIEAVVAPGHRCAVGLQWHPEYLDAAPFMMLAHFAKR